LNKLFRGKQGDMVDGLQYGRHIMVSSIDFM
jgi:hypothetical protein